MNNDLSPILERIRKLRNLAQGNKNEHEAAAAAAKAEKLIAEHGIAEAMLDIEPEGVAPGAVGEPVNVMGKRFTHWRSYLLSNLCELHGCAHGYIGRRQAVFFGRPSDVALVRELYDWLAGEVDHLARKQNRKGKRWVESYRLGCVRGIGDAMLAAQEAARRNAPVTALAVLEDRLKDAKAALDNATKESKPIDAHDDDDIEEENEAFEKGCEDGWKVQARGKKEVEA